MAEHEFDPETCITAGELRAKGLHVEDSVPDCGWVPTQSIQFDAIPQKNELTDEQRAWREFPTLDITITFMEPFRWVHFKGTVEI